METQKKSPDYSSRPNRPAAVAGKFYPGTPKMLREEVERHFREAKPPQHPGESPQALIAPHAGYLFSGRVAASAFNQIPGKNSYKRVFIIASSHQMHFPGVSVWTAGDYETPLGTVSVDQETCRLLKESSPLFQCREDAHLAEHSLEVQLPFLQVKLEERFQLVPLILGTGKAEDCEKIAGTLRPWFIPENLFVVSSDLSHYPCYNDAVSTDRVTTEAILSNSPEQLLLRMKENRTKGIPGLATSLCGWTGVLTLLYLTRGEGFHAEWTDYLNSGDEPRYGDQERVVGYSAVTFYRNSGTQFFLSPQEKKALLAIADRTVRETVVAGKCQQVDEEPLSGNLAAHAGAFVSIYIAGKLRGCIGSFTTGEPLAHVVSRSAVSATADTRFNPVEPEELESLTIEISVLTPLRRVYSASEVIPGKHGIYIKKGGSSGTFLPQVAGRYGWDREEFLGRCSRDKAGLGWDGWKTAELYVYEAIIFGNSPETGQNTR